MGPHNDHLPNNDLNKGVSHDTPGAGETSKDISRAQGIQTKMDAKAAKDTRISGRQQSGRR